MKFLFLIANRLQQYYQKNKVIFLLFIIGGIFNAIMLCYFYGNLLPAVYNRESEDVNYRKYSASFKEPSYGDFPTLTVLAENEIFESISASGSLPNGSTLAFFRTFTGNYPLVLLSGRGFFTSDYQVIVPYTCPSSLGSSISLCGKYFEIIGKSTESDFYIISMDAFEELGVSQSVTDMVFIASERQSLQNDAVLQLIQNSFPNNTNIRSELKVYIQYDQEDTQRYSSQILINYLVIAVSYMFLLYYLINSIMHENIVSVFVGATKADITALVFWETAILSLSVGGIGLLLHRILYKPLFTKLNVIADLSYQLGDYLVLYLFIFSISLATALPLAARYLRLSPVSAKREHA